MGKAGRVACIFTPMALSIASFICLALIEVAGWHKGTLPSFYFFNANLTQLNVDGGNNQALITAIDTAKDNLAQQYTVYLWNYCSSSTTSTTLQNCSARTSDFVFQPLDVFGFDIANSTSSDSSSDGSAISDAINNAQDQLDGYEDEILGSSGRKALDAYVKVAKWMFIAYSVAFWTGLAVIVAGILAIFTRWGSLLTWLLSLVSSVFTVAAVLTSTILFSVLSSALNEALKDYGIKFAIGKRALEAGWAAVLFTWAATLFWLFSICCCSGRSNPHHRSNKGGLWNAEPKGQGYGNTPLQVEKTGGGYQRVSSPYPGRQEDTIPLQNYAQPVGYGKHQVGAGYEPYRHG